jgi:hypothetical protein
MIKSFVFVLPIFKVRILEAMGFLFPRDDSFPNYLCWCKNKLFEITAP